MYLNHFMIDGLTSFITLTALTSGVVQVVKKAGVENKWLPLVALFIGVFLTFLGGVTNVTSLSVLTGIAIGLSSCGLYDITKKSLLGK